MKKIILSAKVPYSVEYVRRGRRTVESLIVWDKGPIVVLEVEEEQTDLAYRIGPRRPSVQGYDIRSFDGKIWWPLFFGSQPVSVDAFKAGIGDPDGCFLSTMSLSPSTLYPLHSVTQQQFDDDFLIGRVTASMREERWRVANRSAARLLFCNGFVFQEGGEPAYFGTISDKSGNPTVLLRIGGLRIGLNQPGERWHLGLSASQRRRAARRAFVFQVEEIDAACRALTHEGFCPIVAESTTIECAGARELSAAEFCAEAMARTVLSPLSAMPAHYWLAMSRYLRLAKSDHPIQRAQVRAIIMEGLSAIGAIDSEKCFGFKREWALRAFDRLESGHYSPALSPEDEDALSNCILL